MDRELYFISRFGASHGFVAHKSWLSPKQLTLLFLFNLSKAIPACSWARQSSGALAIRPKSGDSGYQPSIRLPQRQVTQAGQQ